MFGLDADTLRNIKKVFATLPNLEKVILYGSRAKGNYKDGSDIDITLLGKQLTLKTVYALEEVLEELYLPYTFDISIFTQIDNDDLIKHILRVGKTFYFKENGKLKTENIFIRSNNMGMIINPKFSIYDKRTICTAKPFSPILTN
jgi:predicted nucleotidyltransferase